ncbi:MAG: hypothetical protein AABZ39_20075 [Spirochaetota bacterium]
MSTTTSNAGEHGARIEAQLGRVALSFLTAIPGGGTIEEQSHDMLSFLKKLSRTDVYRDRNSVTLHMIETGMLAGVCRGLFASDSGFSQRIAGENRFHLDANGLLNFISVSLLMRDLVYTKGPMIYDAYRYDERSYDARARVFLDETYALCEKLMPSISDVYFSIVFKSVIRFTPDDASVPALSRLLLVLDHFSKMLPLSAADAPHTLSSPRSAAYILATNACFFGLDPSVTAELAACAEAL